MRDQSSNSLQDVKRSNSDFARNNDRRKNNKIFLTKLSSKIYSIIYKFILSKGLEKNYVKLIILK